MTRPTKPDGTLPRIIGALLVGLTATAVSAGGSAPPEQSVTVRVDHFTYENWSSADLETLALTMRAARPAWVELVACGPDASWALQSVAQRLSDLPLQLQALPPTAPACAGVSTAKAASPGLETSSADKVAVARYWQQVMP